MLPLLTILYYTIHEQQRRSDPVHHQDVAMNVSARKSIIQQHRVGGCLPAFIPRLEGGQPGPNPPFSNSDTASPGRCRLLCIVTPQHSSCGEGSIVAQGGPSHSVTHVHEGSSRGTFPNTALAQQWPLHHPKLERYQKHVCRFRVASVHTSPSYPSSHKRISRYNNLARRDLVKVHVRPYPLYPFLLQLEVYSLFNAYVVIC